MSNLAIYRCLENVVHGFGESAHFKDGKSREYKITNQYNLCLWSTGGQINLFGKTLVDLNSMMVSQWSEDSTKSIQQKDDFVIYERKPTQIDDQYFLDCHGKLFFHVMDKTPVFNLKGGVLGILTLSTDKTDSLSLFALYHHYSQISASQQLANRLFMKHLGVEHFFASDAMLTRSEILVILNRLKYRSNRRLAEKTHKSKKTIEAHISHINLKLGNTDIDDFLDAIVEKKYGDANQ